MGNQHTTIVINGKRYDARTGKLMSEPAAVKAATKATAKPAASRRISDIARTAQLSKPVHKPLERSKTLMRHAVKKPAKLAAQKPGSAKTLADIKSPKVASITSSPALHHQFDAEREARAQHIKRSSLVSKFNDMAVRPVNNAVHAAQPVRRQVKPLAVQPAPAAVSYPRPKKRTATQSVLEKGLRAAQSHTETSPKPAKKSRRKSSRRSRLASIGAGGLAILLLGSFIAYQNVPNIAMRYAAARSGVQASLPSYRPSGFALNSHIQYTPGQITVQFSSNSDDRNFSITQRESTWNSETLRSNYVASASDQVQTYEDKGRTIYLYGDSNATWVNGGIWYEINGNSELNSDQLIRIATSM